MTENAPSVVIVAGEASGDLHGACLAARLKQMLPNADIRGVGGLRMREAGVALLCDSSSWSAIGITEALRLVPRLLLELRKLRSHLKAHPPDALVLIDFGAFNIRLGRSLPAGDTKVLYYFPPGSWNRGETYERLKGIPNRVVTPFPWSAEALNRRGFRAEFFGHPLLDIVKPSLSQDAFCRRFGFDSSRPIVGLLPGSRSQEIVHNLPALALAAARLAESMPELQFAIPLAPSISSSAIAEELARTPWIEVERHHAEEDPESSMGRASHLSIADRVRSLARREQFAVPASPVAIKLLPGMAYDLLTNARAAAVTSGTATVEAMILGCPMVIIYRGSRLTTWEFRLRCKNVKFIGMPNIILDKEICPELIAEDASPSRISDLMLTLIQGSPERAEMLRGLAEAKAVLGSLGAVEKTARVVLEMLHQPGSTRNNHDKDTEN
ncbi:MAG TPA: hypothetical protein VMX94_01525 [Armatimonadota bacterium]|nr:hypothetical protein [Armatimonadota bacterium]